MSSKPIKYGFKAYVLAEAGTGYVIRWILYEGKKRSMTVESIVLKLLEGLEHDDYRVCMDRFYTTLGVIQKLGQQGVECFGTVMKNRVRLTEEMEE